MINVLINTPHQIPHSIGGGSVKMLVSFLYLNVIFLLDNIGNEQLPN